MKQLCAALAGAVIAVPAWGCSICRCGDPTFNALGNEGVAQTGLRLALDWDQVEKTQGSPDEEFSSVHEERTTFLAAYGISDRFGVFARLPYSERSLTEIEDGENEHLSASGLSDPEIYGQARLWSSAFEGDVGVRTSVYAVFGVKTAWGENDASRNGERLDEHVQPGTGSTDWFAGLSGSYQLDPHSAMFASGQYRLHRRQRLRLPVRPDHAAQSRLRTQAGREVGRRHRGELIVIRVATRSIAAARPIPTRAVRSPTSRRDCCSTRAADGSCGPRRRFRCRTPA